MKITKKIIIILAFMITMIATLGIAKVDAAGSLPTKNDDGVNIDYSKLKLNASYHIAYKEDYLKKPHLFCVEKGQRLNSTGRDYTYIKHIRIENSQSWTIKKNGKKSTKEKGSSTANKKLATAIVTLNSNDLQEFIWGYFATWVDKVGSKYHNVPSDFAIEKQGENFKEIDEEVEEKLEDMISSVDDFEDVTDYNNITFEPIKIGKEEFEKIGPFKLTGIPSGGLKKFEVKDQNDKNVDGVKLFKTSKESDIIIDANDMSQNKGDTKVIKNNKAFYICIPKSKKVTQFSVNIVAEKTDITNVTADLYLLKCDDEIHNDSEAWQNLVITKGNIDSGKKDVDISTNKITMPGDLTIIKKGSNNNELLSGAQFVIFRYVENDKGSWYKKGDTYTQNPEEATDKNKKYKREYVRYVGNKYFSYDITSKTIDFDYVKGTPEYIYITDKNGKIQLSSLEKGTYFAKEIKAPEGYKIIDGFFKLGEVKSAQRDKEVTVTNEPDTTNLEITKVNAANHAVVLEGVGFKFKHETEGWLKEISKGKYEYKKNENEATLFKTDNKGKISLPAVRIGKYTYVEDEKTLPDGYVIDNKGEKSFTLKSQNKNEVTIENIQKYVKLSGYVWLDQLDGKKSERNDVYEPYAENELGSKDLLFNGITVRLKNRDTGETIATTTTSKLNRYKDINNGNGEYLFEKVEIANLGKYYIEFEYDGLTYTNVIPHIDQNTGSKAAESVANRKAFNEKFSVVEGNSGNDRNKGYTRGADGKTESGVSLSYNINQGENKNKAILNSNGQYKIADDNSYIQQENIGSYPITATTDEPRKDNKISYSIKDHFKVGELEIKYINLGLYERERPKISLGKELRNVKVTVNGYTYTYDYNERYDSTNKHKEGDFNVGVQFKNGYSGTYTRAIYKSDYEYNPEDKDKELKVYITYELKMLQTNAALKAKINSVVDYFDAEYSLETVGTKMDVADIAKRNSQGELEGKITDDKIEPYNDNYKKVIIPCETELNPQEINSIYVQFKLSREQVADILHDKDIGQVADDDRLLNNVAEINSYSIFDKETGKIYAGIDQDSNPGNCEPGKFETYENDTDSSPALRLEVANAREMTGKVFEDAVVPEKNQKVEEVMTGKERVGSGAYEEGEKGIGGVDITLTDAKSGIVYKTKTVTEDGWYRIDKEEKGNKEYTFKGTKLEQNDGKTNTHELKKGDYYIIGYIPGDYTLTYTWGDKTYTVQDYKGTIYKERERQNSNKWWYVDEKYNDKGEEQNTDNVTRYSDAIDNYETRQKIDDQIKTINKDTNVKNVEKAYEGSSETDIITKMNSSTPAMGIGIEYKTAYTASQGDRYSYCIDKIDFGIVERAKQDLVLNKRIKTMKVFSARGDQLVNLTIDEEGNISGEKNSITYMKPSPNASPKNGFIKLELDNETIQGTKLEVGYEIKAYNNSEVDYTTENYYKYGDIDDATKIVTITPNGVIDYLDKNWAFDPKQNEQWQVKTSEELKDLVAEVVYDNKESTLGEKTILYTQGLKEPLKPNRSKDIMLNVSKILTTTDEISLDNETEEVEVTKTGGATLETIPGNYVPGNGAKEADESMAETTIVTPATGEDLNYMIPIIIGTTALIILGVGIIIIKKKVV